MASLIVYMLTAVIVLRIWQVDLSGTRYVLLVSLATTFPMFTVLLYYNYASLQWPVSMLLECIGSVASSNMRSVCVLTGWTLITFATATNQTRQSMPHIVFPAAYSQLAVRGRA